MSEEAFVKEIDEVERRLDDLEEEIGGTEILKINEHSWAHAIAMHQNLPGLRGFWPMSGFDSAGNATDFGNLGHHMQFNGDPDYDYDTLMSYLDLDGVGDYLSVADHADFDIIGNEAYIASSKRGLTIGCWIKGGTTGTEFLLAKDNAGAQRSYALRLNNARLPTFVVYGATVGIVSAGIITATEWHHIVGRYIPSTSVTVFVDGVGTQSVATIPATLTNSTAALTIGASDAPGSYYTGYKSMSFVCAMLLSNAQIVALYQQTRAAAGV